MGPSSPERTGSLPSMKVVDLCYSGKYSFDEMKKKVVGMGGMVAHLGTNDVREVERCIQNGDKKLNWFLKLWLIKLQRKLAEWRQY